MALVVGVRFKPAGKIYYFESRDFELTKGDAVIVETVRGIEYGEVALGKREVEDDQLVLPLKKVIRIANEEDKNVYTTNKQKEKEALELCKEKVHLHNLPMRLIDVEYTFDMGKIIFYFTAEGRVDFIDGGQRGPGRGGKLRDVHGHCARRERPPPRRAGPATLPETGIAGHAGRRYRA